MTAFEGTISTPVINGAVEKNQGIGAEIRMKTINTGENGATFIPSVSDEGVISWENDRELENPPPVNIKGPKGDSPVIELSPMTDGYWISVDGEDVAFIHHGQDGDEGNGIASIKRTKGNGAAGTTDTYTITYTNGLTDTFTVYNGKDGSNGKDGNNGKDGTSVTVSRVIENTVDGGSSVVEFSDGNILLVKNGDTGSAGKDGIDGKDGKTPVKGTDYFTEADKQELVTMVLGALPVAEEASF